ncbi:MAG TPA: TfuA-like protein [Vicinamibacterales bacterium]|jgi:hypothetical protein
MKYDPSLPVAVFLGPSLDRGTAWSILPANYYPPARMGDLYRLMTCGVRVVVIIDGVFHHTAPVWPREILAALDNGLTVVGASSMGALRALELEPFGMIGCGTIVDWYRTGRIEGDDEVALMHAQEEFGYRALSEPLVNIREVLARAADEGVITTAQEARLAAGMKALDHTRRSYPALFASEAFTELPAAAQAAIRDIVVAGGESLKARDARAALEWVAVSLDRLLIEAAADRPAADRTASRRRIARPDEVLLRGVPMSDGDLVSLRDLLVRAAEDRPWAERTVRASARRVFLQDWLRTAGIEPPARTTERFAAAWRRRSGFDGTKGWLAANGLTAGELHEELAARAAEAWLDAEGPAAFDLACSFLEAWALTRGIEPPPTTSCRTLDERLLDQGPGFFGFDLWSPDVACIRELQIQGDIAQWAGRPADAGARAV